MLHQRVSRKIIVGISDNAQILPGRTSRPQLPDKIVPKQSRLARAICQRSRALPEVSVSPSARRPWQQPWPNTLATIPERYGNLTASRRSYRVTKELAGLDDLLVVVGKVPPDNGGILAAADDPASVELQLEDSRVSALGKGA